MKREIYFCVDVESFDNIITYPVERHVSYAETEKAILNGDNYIVTMSLAHLSFDLIEQGYSIFLCYKNKQVKIEPHMDLSGIGEPCKDLRFGHNIFKMFKAGIFNDLIGL